MPLKVLHKVLDEAQENEAFVGISNWALDPAKMNRAVRGTKQPVEQPVAYNCCRCIMHFA